MRVRFICGYYSELAHKKQPRPEPYWDAYWFCWAVKVGKFKRPFFIRRKAGDIHITDANFHLVRGMFGRWAARCAGQFNAEGAYFVPVPSKDALGSTTTYRSLKMAHESLAATAYADSVHDCLRWTQKVPKAHEGGPRSRAALLPLLRADNARGKKVILIDDLFSTGGHLLAAADCLEASGAKVIGAVSCGRTIYDFNTKPFANQEIELTEELSDWAG